MSAFPIIKSFAKINLFFKIVSKSDNGYHFVNTLMAIAEDYYDEISIQESEAFSISTTGDYAFEGVNILEKVVHLCKEKFGFAFNTNFAVNIKKNIKIGAGLGGGSSNAGEFLKFLLIQNKVFLNQYAFCELAIKVGADVSFFYNHLPKICTGYGEIVSEVPFKLPSLYAIIVLPNFSVETKRAFSLINQSDFSQVRIKTFEDALDSVNSFYRVCVEMHPEIKNIIADLKSLPYVLKADVSGSGSACFALFHSKEEAQNASNKISGYPFIITKLGM